MQLIFKKKSQSSLFKLLKNDKIPFIKKSSSKLLKPFLKNWIHISTICLKIGKKISELMGLEAQTFNSILQICYHLKVSNFLY